MAAYEDALKGDLKPVAKEGAGPDRVPYLGAWCCRSTLPKAQGSTPCSSTIVLCEAISPNRHFP